MPGKKLDALLYVVLSAAALLYLYFNVIAAGRGVSAPHRMRGVSSGMSAGINDKGINEVNYEGDNIEDNIGDVSCTICGGERGQALIRMKGMVEANRNEAEYRRMQAQFIQNRRAGRRNMI